MLQTVQMPARDFNDRRVFFTFDPVAVGQYNLSGANGDAPVNLFYEQSAYGPIKAVVNRDVSDAVLGQMATRHGLDVAQLIAFRDRANDGEELEAKLAGPL